MSLELSEFKVTFPAQIGNLELTIKDYQLRGLFICQKDKQSKATPMTKLTGDKINDAIMQQLQDYFSVGTPFHDLPLAPEGTKYEQQVWNALCKIPYGETRTYSEIAHKLNSSPRAVGNACRKNPIAIIIPCHRVVAASGIGGFAGQTNGKQVGIKRWLLQHEGVAV